MKFKLLSLIVMMTKLIFYGTLVQVFTCSLLLALSSDAQIVESIKDKKLDLNLKNASLSKVFVELERQTGYEFTYDRKILKSNLKVDLVGKNQKVYDYLLTLSKDANLKFKQYNNNISVSLNNNNDVMESPISITMQAINITGRITSSDDGEGLPGVNVIVKGTLTGTVTDIEGNYRLNAPENGILVISSVGYISEEVSVGGRSVIDFAMTTDVTSLDEIVVIGYGEQKKANLTGSVVTVGEADFENRVVSNPIQALQGKVAGLRVTQTTGTPGNEGLSFQIRGANSFSSDPAISNAVKNKPLILINGIIGDLTDLDPAFIESITVLKDAASASIYGARAANGVILVTTKSGSGKGLNVTYTGRVMSQSRINLLDRYRESVDFMNLVNDVVAPHTGRYYSDEVINNFRTNPSDEFPNFDHEDFYIRDVTIQNHNIQIGGATEKTNYNIGFGYWDQNGITRGFGYKRLNALFNVESQVNDFVKIGAFVSGVDGSRIEPYNGERDYLMGILSQSPTYKPTLLDGSGRYTGSNGGSEPESVGYADIASKNAQAISENDNARIYDDHFTINANAFLDVTLLKGLTWYSKIGLNITQTDYKRRRPILRMYSYRSGEFQGNLDNIGTEELQHTVTNSEHYTMFSHLRYQKSFNDAHNFSIMLGASQETQNIESIQGVRRGFASPNLDVLSGAPVDGQTNAGNINEFVLQSLFGRFTYDYKGKYLFEANFRRDGSSRFQEDNRFGFFPSYSAAWRISEEAFMASASSWLTNFKVRFSNGKMGNDQIGFYPYQSVLQLGRDYPFGGSLTGGGRREQLANSNIQWEETQITDIGLDLNLKGNLFTMTFDYYDKTTEGILRIAQLPTYSGLLPPFVNEGVVNNKGFELILGHQNSIGEFNYGVNFNVSKYTNKLVSFGTRTFGTNAMIEGEEMNRYYMYQADGIYQSEAEITSGPEPRWPAVPGDLRYKDIDGDNKITPDDRVDVDGVNPDFFYGFEITANWKGFDFALFFQGEKGRKVLLNDPWSLIMPFSVHGAQPIHWWDDSWTPENQSTEKPRMFYMGAPDGQSIKEANTFWLREASYIRLKNLSIGYSLPSKVLENVFLTSARFFFNAENLATFSKFEFGDPERPSDNLYPLFRTLTLGTTIKF